MDSGEAAVVVGGIVVWGGGLGALAFFLAVRPWYRKRKSRRGLADLAWRIGLRHYESKAIGSSGTYGGVLRDYNVWLDPDNGLLKVWMLREHALELDPVQPTMKPDDGWAAFDSPSPALNKRFRTRYAAQDLVPCLTRPGPYMDRISSALRHCRGWRLEIESNEIVHVPLRNRGRDAFIPIDGLQDRIAALVDIACALDELLSESSGTGVSYRTCPKCGAAAMPYADSDERVSCNNSDCTGT